MKIEFYWTKKPEECTHQLVLGGANEARCCDCGELVILEISGKWKTK